MNGPRYENRDNSGDLPRILHRQTDAIVISEWLVETPARQQATLETSAAAWLNVPWPAGLLSTTLLASTDGTAVLNFAQWTSAEAYTAFVQTHRKSIAEQV